MSKLSIQLLEADTSEAWQQDKVDKFSYPFLAFRVKLERLNDFNEEEFIECMGREYFCRLGGDPVFLSDPIEMRCPKCGRNMQYVGELTDNNFDNSALLNGLDFYFGDMFLYYYYCMNVA
ncbi:hypothetical protein [Selenomonas ruminantium]|uniref:Uncharacterized protein n=1 Tax=Selenomonas ruminantium TaxID=971 RepID=A0A1H0QAC7_SELRU|nr:hypothetical protein [Selenomonas ruminantium]SDP14332.1 hypothetical protein SAMN05216366_10772 [Selenomonas ruminantium]